MCDEEDLLSSDSEDEDYEPSAQEVADLSEEEESGEDEAQIFAQEGGEPVKKIGKSKKKKRQELEASSRKRKGGIKLEEEESEANKDKNTEDDYSKQLAKDIQEETQEKKKVEEKKKADDLWASFMSDVGSRPKPKPKASSGLASLSSITKTTSTQKKAPEKGPDTKPTASSSNGKVTITKEFDFAGETVRVTQKVDADSKEAKAEVQRKEEGNSEPKAATAVPTPGLKRPGGGLGSVLGKIGKKPKIGTLQKSKLDWDQFKEKEGIGEELATHNRGKEGYIERMQFLQRTDYRQFEQERDLRLHNQKKL